MRSRSIIIITSMLLALTFCGQPNTSTQQSDVKDYSRSDFTVTDENGKPIEFTEILWSYSDTVRGEWAECWYSLADRKENIPTKNKDELIKALLTRSQPITPFLIESDGKNKVIVPSESHIFAKSSIVDKLLINEFDRYNSGQAMAWSTVDGLSTALIVGKLGMATVKWGSTRGGVRKGAQESLRAGMNYALSRGALGLVVDGVKGTGWLSWKGIKWVASSTWGIVSYPFRAVGSGLKGAYQWIKNPAARKKAVQETAETTAKVAKKTWGQYLAGGARWAGNDFLKLAETGIVFNGLSFVVGNNYTKQVYLSDTVKHIDHALYITDAQRKARRNELKNSGQKITSSPHEELAIRFNEYAAFGKQANYDRNNARYAFARIKLAVMLAQQGYQEGEGYSTIQSFNEALDGNSFELKKILENHLIGEKCPSLEELRGKTQRNEDGNKLGTPEAEPSEPSFFQRLLPH